MKKVTIVVLLIIANTLSVFAQDDARAAAAWRVVKYDITANVPRDAADRYLSAKATLSLQNSGNAAGSRLTLRISDKAEVAAVQLNGATASFTKGEEKVTSARNLQRIIVTLPSIQPGAAFSVTVDYKLKVEENSGLNALSGAGAQFLPLSFWYPTPTSMYSLRGADFAPFKLTVNSGAENTISSGVQSGAALDQKLNGQPFFITGSWDAVEGVGDTKGISVSIPKGADKSKAQEFLTLVAAAKSYVSSALGVSPDVPVRIVFVRRGAGFSDGGTVLLDQGAFRRQKLDPQTVMTITESIAKMYLGNTASVKGEGYGVFREGLSRYIATQFIEKQYGKDVADAERLRHSIAYSAIAKRDGPLATASPLDDYYFSAMSNKGSMVWRILAASIGHDQMLAVIKSQMGTGSLTLANTRAAFSGQKEELDYLFDQVTDMNLMAGLPRQEGGAIKVALRNLGGIQADVNVLALTDKGEKLVSKASVPPKSFGEAVFRTTNKVTRVEIDPEKVYPQSDYSDDVAPREFTESDPISVIKRAFDKQDYAGAEKASRLFLQLAPRYTDAGMWLGRSLLAQGRTADAERAFKDVLDDKLPTARSVAWTNLGLGDIALKAGNNTSAANFYTQALKADAEYGASLAARAGREKLGASGSIDLAITGFFAQFDKAAVSNRKAEVDSLIVPGEIIRFSGGIAGQAQQWQTSVKSVDVIDANTVQVETALNIKMLNKDAESGMAVYQLTKAGGTWKLSGVEIFEVR